jgi:Holliday junction resolvase RusA-like endonuclease
MAGLLRIPPVRPELSVAVRTRPRPQGSKRSIALMDRRTGLYTGRTATVESSSGLKQFRTDVRTQAQLELPAGWRPLDEPVTVLVVFSLPRPAGHFRTGRHAGQLRPAPPGYPTSRTGPSAGDTDKVLRAVVDALDAAGVFTDDSCVTDAYAGKRFAGGPGDLALESPGVVVRVWRTAVLDEWVAARGAA